MQALFHHLRCTIPITPPPNRWSRPSARLGLSPGWIIASATAKCLTQLKRATLYSQLLRLADRRVQSDDCHADACNQSPLHQHRDPLPFHFHRLRRSSAARPTFPPADSRCSRRWANAAARKLRGSVSCSIGHTHPGALNDGAPRFDGPASLHPSRPTANRHPPAQSRRVRPRHPRAPQQLGRHPRRQQR